MSMQVLGSPTVDPGDAYLHRMSSNSGLLWSKFRSWVAQHPDAAPIGARACRYFGPLAEYLLRVGGGRAWCIGEDAIETTGTYAPYSFPTPTWVVLFEATLDGAQFAPGGVVDERYIYRYECLRALDYANFLVEPTTASNTDDEI